MLVALPTLTTTRDSTMTTTKINGMALEAGLALFTANPDGVAYGGDGGGVVGKLALLAWLKLESHDMAGVAAALYGGLNDVLDAGEKALVIAAQSDLLAGVSEKANAKPLFRVGEKGNLFWLGNAVNTSGAKGHLRGSQLGVFLCLRELRDALKGAGADVVEGDTVETRTTQESAWIKGDDGKKTRKTIDKESKFVGDFAGHKLNLGTGANAVADWQEFLKLLDVACDALDAAKVETVAEMRKRVKRERKAAE